MSPQAAAKYRSALDVEHDQRALSSLVRNLAESDHEVSESERRESRRTREANQHHYRSSSHSSTGALRTSASTSFQQSTSLNATTGSSRRESPPKFVGVSGARRSPEQAAAPTTRLSNGRVVEEHLTESFLTSRGDVGAGSRAGQSRTTPTAGLTGEAGNSSFNLQTVGHHAGSSSLRVNRATPTGQIGRGGVAMK